MTEFVIRLLAAHHDRSNFACGVEALDRYLREGAGQDARRRVARCFVAAQDDDDPVVAGYYTFSAAEIRAEELREEEKRRLPRYAAFPAALIGRLAVDRHFRGRRLGAAMIFDAARRADRADPAIFALLVDAKDETVASFYRRLEFSPLASNPLSLYLPIAKRP